MKKNSKWELWIWITVNKNQTDETENPMKISHVCALLFNLTITPTHKQQPLFWLTRIFHGKSTKFGRTRETTMKIPPWMLNDLKSNMIFNGLCRRLSPFQSKIKETHLSVIQSLIRHQFLFTILSIDLIIACLWIWFGFLLFTICNLKIENFDFDSSIAFAISVL